MSEAGAPEDQNLGASEDQNFVQLPEGACPQKEASDFLSKDSSFGSRFRKKTTDLGLREEKVLLKICFLAQTWSRQWMIPSGQRGCAYHRHQSHSTRAYGHQI